MRFNQCSDHKPNTYLYGNRGSRPKVFVKKVFLEILQNSEGTPVPESLF